jgi:TPR repeat protein
MSRSRLSNEATTAEATFNCGCLIYDIDAFPMNKSLASDCFKFAADRGHGEGQFLYGRMLANRDGIPLDEELATICF